MAAIHAMAGTNKSGHYVSPEVARNFALDFMMEQLNLARKYLKEGNCPGYYQALGFAMHPAQDQWASGHDFLAGIPGDYSSLIPHFFGDMFPSNDAIQSAFNSSLFVLQGNAFGALRPSRRR